MKNLESITAHMKITIKETGQVLARLHTPEINEENILLKQIKLHIYVKKKKITD
jgi:hypothetical protein